MPDIPCSSCAQGWAIALCHLLGNTCINELEDDLCSDVKRMLSSCYSLSLLCDSIDGTVSSTSGHLRDGWSSHAAAGTQVLGHTSFDVPAVPVHLKRTGCRNITGPRLKCSSPGPIEISSRPVPFSAPLHNKNKEQTEAAWGVCAELGRQAIVTSNYCSLECKMLFWPAPVRFFSLQGLSTASEEYRQKPHAGALSQGARNCPSC